MTSNAHTQAIIKSNIDALELAVQLEDANSKPDDSELRTIKQYSGWGQVSRLFDEKALEFQGQRQRLEKLVGKNDYLELRSSILSSYYTPAYIADAMWSGLKRLGFCGGTVLEPCVGSGALIDTAPKSLQENIEWTAIERCPSSSRIFSLLHPKAKTVNDNFENVGLVNDSFNAAIINPPFLETNIADSFDRSLKGSVHNFFMMKTVQKLMPGAVFAAVVSRYFMDSKDSSARIKVAEKAKLLNAIRLPAGAFSESGTSVVTDILFFEIIDGNGTPHGWEETILHRGNPDLVMNEWFAQNPNSVLGDITEISSMNGPTLSVTFTGTHEELVGLMDDQINTLPTDVFDSGEAFNPKDHNPSIEMPSKDRTNEFCLGLDILGMPVQRMDDLAGEKRFRNIELAQSKIDRLTQLISIKHLAIDLLNAEISETSSETLMSSMRQRLNMAYDKFVSKFGAIHGVGNSFMKECPEFGILLGLEVDYDKGVSKSVAEKEGVDMRGPSWEKADIFNARVCYPQVEPKGCDNSKDALSLSMRKYGKVDLGYMVEISGLSIEQIKSDLNDSIFCIDPVQDIYQIADQYLAGNVRSKLAEAKERSDKHSLLLKNVAALEEVLPADINPSDIHVGVGAPWVNAEYLTAFIEHMVDAKDIRPVFAGGTWFMKLDEHKGNRAKQTSTYGTQRRHFGDLFNRMINNKPLTVYDYIDEKKVVNMVETQACEGKAQEIRDAWDDWIFADPERRNVLAQKYNELFNSYIRRSYDGSFLVDDNGLLPNQNPSIQLGPHQLNTCWRAVVTGNLLADLCVGAGKTFSALAAIMESRRMGLISKSMVVCPNHLLANWRSEIARLYPGAKVLVAGDDDLSKQKRRRFIAAAAMGEYDIILLAQSAFKFIEAPHEHKLSFMWEQINEIIEAIEITKEVSGNDWTVRQMEKRKENLQAKVKKLMDRPNRDRLLTFDQIGVDFLVLDESQSTKNLFYTSSLTGVAGMGIPEGSQFAFDVFCKVRYLQEKHGGRGYMSLSGTPISNSVIEAWTNLRFHAYDYLKDTGMHYLDSWISVHSEPTTQYEMSVSGAFKLKTRLSQFCNVPELLNAYGAIAETVTKADLKTMYSEAGKIWPEPEMEGGKPYLVVAERSPLQEAYMADILKRAENMSNVDPSVDNWLKLTSDATKVSLDPRLIDPLEQDFLGSKINLCVNNVANLYKETVALNGTQLVFCDMGTPTGTALFNIYECLKEKLIRLGVKAQEIAFIHDAKTLNQKAHLEAKMNRGEIRVLIGSTAKAGSGLNIQRLLVGLHNLDLAWRPSDAEQRLGRGLRQGNKLFNDSLNRISKGSNEKLFTLKVYFYATDRTLDSHRYQTVEIKANFIDQFRKGELDKRTIRESDDGNVSSFGQMKALISGNPLIMLHYETDQRIEQLLLQERAYKRRVWSAENFKSTYSDIDEQTDRKIEKNAIDVATLQQFDVNEPVFEFNGKRVDGFKNVIEALTHVINDSFNRFSYMMTRGIELGSINGFDLSLSKGWKGICFSLEGEFNSFSYDYLEGKRISTKRLVEKMMYSLVDVRNVESELRSQQARINSEMEVMVKEAQKTFSMADELDYKRKLYRAITETLAKDDGSELPDEFIHELNAQKEEATNVIREDDLVADNSPIELSAVELAAIMDAQEEITDIELEEEPIAAHIALTFAEQGSFNFAVLTS